MSIWQPTKTDLTVSRGAKATLGEVIGSVFDRDVPEAGFNPAERLEIEAYEPLTDFLGGRAAVLEDSMIPDLYTKQGADLSIRKRIKDQQALPDDQTISDLIADLDAKGIEYPDDIRPENIAKRREEIIAERAAQAAETEELLSRASKSTAIFGGFIGSAGAQFTDAFNLATLPIGASARAGLLATIGIEAALNAGIEGLQTPGRNAYREMIGEEKTNVFANMAFGAVFGGGIAGVIKGGAAAARAATPKITDGARVVGAMIKDRLAKTTAAREAAQSDNPELRHLGEAVLRDVEDEAAAVVVPDKLAVREHEARAQAATIAGQTGEALEIPDRPAVATPRPSIINGELEEVDPRTLLVQPEIWQFKSDIVAPGGVTAKLQKVTEWDSASAGVVLVYEYPDGSRAIVDGHQRTALATRIMAADPSKDIRLAAKVFREIDGFSAEDVRVLAAMKNIREAADGMTAKMAADAAKILRIRPENLRNLPAGPGIARAQELAALADEAFDLVINRVIPPDQAAAIGRMVKDKAMHGPIAKLLARVQPETAMQTESMISQALEAPVSRETTADLFGEQEVAESLYLERAKVLERTMRILREDRGIFKMLSDKTTKIEGAGKNRLDTETNQALRETMEKALVAVSALAHRAGPISEALNDAAKRYKADGRLADAADRVRGIVRDEIERNGLAGGRTGADGSASKSADSGATALDSNVSFSEIEGPGFKEQIEATRIDTTPAERAQTNVRDLKQMLREMAPPDEIEEHPEVVKALAAMTERAKDETRNRPGYDSNDWHDRRRYSFDGEEVIGTEAAASRWLQQARDFAGPDGPATDKVATILLGPPAAGKSTIAESLALTKRSAILDSDEIKKTLPEYDGGIGAAAVHEESSDLANILERMIIESGANVMVPKVGGSPGSIRKAITRFKAAGYQVEVINMAVTADNAYRRMIGRFISSGRLIPPAYVREVGDNPSITFRTLKEEGQADGFAEIDNNGGINDAKPISEISGRNPFAGSRYDLEGSGGKGSDSVTGPGTDPSQAAQSELTQAGEQTLFPGVAPITPADRLQARADAPLRTRPRGSDSEIGGLFDPLDPVRSDLFDLVPTGRGFNDEGNEVPLVMTREELAADLDADDEALAVLDVCIRGANRNGA